MRVASAISKCVIEVAHCAAIEVGLAASGLGGFADGFTLGFGVGAFSCDAFDSEGTLELDECSTRSGSFDDFGALLSIHMALDFAAVHLLSFSPKWLVHDYYNKELPKVN